MATTTVTTPSGGTATVVTDSLGSTVTFGDGSVQVWGSGYSHAEVVGSVAAKMNKDALDRSIKSE